MTKINVDDYEEYGLGNLYYGLINFISKYVTANFDPMKIFSTFDNEQSIYAFAVDNMKTSLKELLEYLKCNKEIFLPNLNKKISIDNINLEEQLALEQRCQEYLIAKLEESLNNLKSQNNFKHNL